MESERLERALERNTDDISRINNTMAEVVATMKANEQRYTRDIDERKEVLTEIKKLSEAVGNVRGLEKEVANYATETAKLRHDVANVMQAQVVLPTMANVITKNETKLEAIEKTIDSTNLPKLLGDVAALTKIRDEGVGGAKVIGFAGKMFWSMFGGVIISGMIGATVWGVDQYNDKHRTTISTPASVEIIEHEQLD